MKFNKLCYILVFFTTVTVSLLLFYSYRLYTRNVELETTNLQLQQEINNTDSLLDSYQLLESDIISLGATPEQAKDIIKASKLYDIDPKPSRR